MGIFRFSNENPGAWKPFLRAKNDFLGKSMPKGNKICYRRVDPSTFSFKAPPYCTGAWGVFRTMMHWSNPMQGAFGCWHHNYKWHIGVNFQFSGTELQQRRVSRPSIWIFAKTQFSHQTKTLVSFCPKHNSICDNKVLFQWPCLK